MSHPFQPSPMCTILLVRHGRVDGMTERLWGRTDVSLNLCGIDDAESAADACCANGLDAIVCSPRRRARETAAILAARTSAPVRIAPEFDEVDYGRWTGRPFEELAEDAAWRQYNEARATAVIPGGETLDALTRRIRMGLDQVQRESAGRVAIVTHAEVIRGALLLASGRSWAAWADIQPAPASVTRLEWIGSTPAV